MIKNIPENVLIICKILYGYNYQAYLVGGCVRDSLLNLIPNDWDITTDAMPEEVVDIFENSGYKVIPTGIKHGTVSILINDITYEVTTYRQDGKYSDGRHPDEVRFSTNLFTDLSRRDFTINAMAYDPLLNILVDRFGGKEDLENGIIKAVGNANERIQEDYLRMLRAVRYASRFNFNINGMLLKAITDNSSNILKVSQERIFQEIYKMASERGSKFAKSISLLQVTGLLEQILPEVAITQNYEHTPETHPEGGVFAHILAIINENQSKLPDINLACLFHDIGKPKAFTNTDKIRYINHHELGLPIIDKIAERLRISNELKERLKFVCKWHMIFHRIEEMPDSKLTKLILDPNWDLLFKVAYLDDSCRGSNLCDKDRWQKIAARVHNLKQKYAEQEKFTKIRRIISGDLIKSLTGLEQGVKIGLIIQKTLEYIVDNSLDAERDMDKIKEFILNNKEELCL